MTADECQRCGRVVDHVNVEYCAVCRDYLAERGELA